MKNKFPEYYKPELSALWAECHFVFDTNVFMDLYYTKNIYSKFIDILENKISDRIWMPYQVGLEFHKHCFDPVKDKEKQYYEFIGIIKGIKKSIKKPFEKLSENNHFLDVTDFFVIGEFNNCLIELNKTLDRMVEIMGENHDFFAEDNIRNTLDTIFKDKIGDDYSEEELEEIYKEGKERYANKIPPGFKDDKYGDLVIWHQIIDYGKDKEVPIIFVTQDSKIDWWLRSKSGDTINPHPYLIKEFSSITNQEIYMYKFSDFLKNAKSFLDIDIDSETIESVEEIEEINDLENELEELEKSKNTEETFISNDVGDAFVKAVKAQQRVGSFVNSPSFRSAVTEAIRTQYEIGSFLNSSPVQNALIEVIRTQREVGSFLNSPVVRSALVEAVRRQQELNKQQKDTNSHESKKDKKDSKPKDEKNNQ